MVIDYALQIGCFDAFVIEELEQNLYPTNQRELIQFLLNRIDRVSNTIITTHSPYVLSCLNVMLLAWRIASEFQDGAKVLAENYNGVYFGDKMISVYALDLDADSYCKKEDSSDWHKWLRRSFGSDWRRIRSSLSPLSQTQKR